MVKLCTCYILVITCTGKVILLKDLSNVNTKLNSSKSRNNLEESIRIPVHMILHAFHSYNIVMLRWFVEGNIVKTTIKSLGRYLIDEEDAETRPERVPCAVFDENVCWTSGHS